MRLNYPLCLFTATIYMAFLLFTNIDAKSSVFGAESSVLRNGMRVVVVSNHRVPIASHMVWYNVGSADEGLGESGIAHFLEHLMFKGTKSYPSGQISEIVARNGGNQNAFTSYDYTAYYQNIPVEKLPKMMELEADRMQNLVLLRSDVDTERQVVLEERRMRVDSQPSSILSERLNFSLWGTNHYSIPVIGWREEIEKLSYEQIFNFYNRWYTPSNATLVVVGDITFNSVVPMAEKYYGKIKFDKNFIPRSRSSFLLQSSDIRVTMRDEKVRQPRWQRTYIAPSVNIGSLSDVYSLQVLSEILGSSSISRLYQSLVVNDSLATSIYSGYLDAAVSWGRFVIYASPSPGVSISELETKIDEQLNLIVNEGVTEEEVEVSKMRLKSEIIYAKDSPMQVAQTIGSLLSVGMSLEDIESWPNRISEVRVDQVNEIARRIFTESASATGILLPKGDD